MPLADKLLLRQRAIAERDGAAMRDAAVTLHISAHWQNLRFCFPSKNAPVCSARNVRMDSVSSCQNIHGHELDCYPFAHRLRSHGILEAHTRQDAHYEIAAT